MRFLIAMTLMAGLVGCSKKEPEPEPPKLKEVTQPSNEMQAKEATDDFLKAKDLAVYKTVSAIPAACLEAFEQADFDNDPDLAEPPADGNHAKWDGKATPTSKRLILAGTNARSCFVYFRKGSSVPTYQLQIFHLGPPATLSYHGMDAEHVYSDLASLRKALIKDSFMRISGPEKL
jgi:hypothetical protein